MKKIGRKLVLLVSLIATMVFCIAGCSAGRNKLKAGTYSGSSEGEKGVISSTFVFEKDGTCTYECVYHTYYKEHTASYTGVYSKTGENDTYEIMLNEMGNTLYAKVLDSGEVIVSSDGYGWSTETFTKE